jgi:hypothetical protein
VLGLGHIDTDEAAVIAATATMINATMIVLRILSP